MKRALHLTFALLALLAVAGCSEKQRSDGTLTAHCRPSITAAGKEIRQPHPTTPSACKYAVVMYCNACVYDPYGGLSHSVSEPCGVCFGISF